MNAKRIVLPAFAGLLVAALAHAGDDGAPAVGKPAAIKDGNALVDVTVGHAAPLVVDWDGDGKKDLLVGQFGEGKLRIYLNKGTDQEPRFDGFTYLQVGGEDATVPTG